jgi:hypothetical protein
VTVQTAAEAVVTYVTSYADGDSHGDNGGGLANASGKYSDNFVIDPQSPRGEATVTATSSKRGKGVSFAQTTFTVGC